MPRRIKSRPVLKHTPPLLEWNCHAPVPRHLLAAAADSALSRFAACGGTTKNNSRGHRLAAPASAIADPNAKLKERPQDRLPAER